MITRAAVLFTIRKILSQGLLHFAGQGLVAFNEVGIKGVHFPHQGCHPGADRLAWQDRRQLSGFAENFHAQLRELSGATRWQHGFHGGNVTKNGEFLWQLR
jgi:hypothetical protein